MAGRGAVGAHPRGRAAGGRPGAAGSRPPSGGGALPDLRRPRVLVPLASNRAAAEAVRQYSDGMTQRARLAKAAVGLALRSGALPLWLRRRGLVVAAAGPAEGSCSATTSRRPRPLRPGGRDRARPVRPNRKPVVQLIGRDGRPVGYMKVGWNDLTRRLVRAEADTLRRLAGAGPRGFTAPGLLHQGRWQGLDITISSALPHRLWRRGRRYALPPVAVSARSPPSAGSRRRRWGRAAGGRGCGSGSAGSPGPRGDPRRDPGAAGRARLDPARLRHLARRLGAVEPALHPGRLLVWDWERSADGVPLGFDLLHFGYQTALQGLGQPPAAAAAASRGRPPRTWPSWASGREVEELLCDLYLLERLCRAAEAEVSAVTGRPDSVGAALLGGLLEGPPARIGGSGGPPGWSPGGSGGPDDRPSAGVRGRAAPQRDDPAGPLPGRPPQISGFADTGVEEDEGQHLQTVYPRPGPTAAGAGSPATRPPTSPSARRCSPRTRPRACSTSGGPTGTWPSRSWSRSPRPTCS